MTIKSALTPKDTIEMRTDFFVQQRGGTYKQVQPIVWNNEWRLKGQISWRNILMIILILYLYFTLSGYVKFYEEFHSRPSEVYLDYIGELASKGIFIQEVYNGDPITIQINNTKD